MMTPQRRLLGVFAHPDDEVFCAGGTFARYCAEGVQAMVVSATRGEAGQIRDATVATRATLGEVREAELRRACAELGVGEVCCLDYLDGTLADVGTDVLADAVGGIIQEFEPDVVVTFGSDGAYGHPDHIAISDAVTAAAQRFGPTGTRLYHSHFPRSRLLLRQRLAQWLVDLGQRFRGSADFALALSLFALESTTMRLAGDDVDVRWYPSGVAIVEQGEPSTALFFVISGEVEVIREDGDGSRHLLAKLGAGEFFGQLGIVGRKTRSAHVVAASTVTCLVLAADEPELYAGRGPEARLVGSVDGDERLAKRDTSATTAIDVRDHVDVKLRAIAAHRSQYPITPDMFPRGMLVDMFGMEYFTRILPADPLESSVFAG